jgi:hypothetical protein
MCQTQNLLTRLSKSMAFYMTEFEATAIAKRLQAEWILQRRKWKAVQAWNAAAFLVAVLAIVSVFIYTGWKL